MQRTIYSLLCFLLLVAKETRAQDHKLDSLLHELSVSIPDTNKVLLLRNIGNLIANQDPQRAIGYWKEGVVLSRKLGYVMGLARSFLNIGTGFAYLSKYDSSVIYCDSAIIYCKIINDPERLALVYLNKADSYRILGNYQAALVLCDTAMSYAEKTSNTDRKARIYTIQSNIYSEQKQFTNALQFLYKALELYKKDKNELMAGHVYDDLGNIYLEKGQQDSSLYFRRKAIAIGEKEKDYKNLSTYYQGVAFILLDKRKYKEAEDLALASLHNANSQSNNLQIGRANTLLAKIYIAQGRFDEAIRKGIIAWDISKEELIDFKQEAAELLSEAYSAAGNYKEGNRFLIISGSFKDSINKSLYNEQLAKLESSFQTREKDKEIQLLNKDKELQQQSLFRQRLLFGAAASLLLFSLLGIGLLINRNRLRQKMKELELRNQIAADLHDEVGSSLSSIHMLSKMVSQPGSDKIDKELLLRMSTNAKETMDKMGDIVWMIKPVDTEAGSLKQRMERFTYEISNSKNIITQVELDDLEKSQLSIEQRKNIYLIFKEALNNSVKYSETEKLLIEAKINSKELILYIKDFGKGFSNEIKGGGNGLKNMKQRAIEIKGTLQIETGEDIGTTITLKVPI